MKFNLSYFWSKFLLRIRSHSLRDCCLHKTAKVSSGCNCINVRMGRYSYMGYNNSLNNVEIGSFVSIASYCSIGGGAHSLEIVSTSPVFEAGRNIFNKNFSHFETTVNKRVLIGNDVWIGESVFVNQGISIGDGAIVGAHSVVTHDVPPYAIVAGVPAKVIRYRFPESTIKALLSLKWWEWEDEKILEYATFFSDPEELVRQANIKINQ